jgi:hypothetical protein
MLGFNHWRVQHKLGLLIGVFLVGFLALGWTARNTLDTVKINSPEYHRIIQGKDLIADILPPPEYIIESYLKVFQMKDETDPVRQAALRDEFRKLRSDYEARHEVWVKELPEGELKREMVENSYRAAMEFYHVADAQFLPAVGRGDRVAAAKLVRGTLSQHYEAHRAAIDKVVVLATRQNELREQEVQALVAGRAAWMLGLGLALVAAVLLISALIGTSVSRPLRRAANAISTFLAECSSTISEQERAAAQQAAAVHQTTTTMEELGASSRLSAEQAEAASGGTREALSLADEGNRTVSETLEGMSSLKDRSSAIATQIMRLSEQTSQIGNITNVVSDLANQTNLLALNAAVEAARAGEHGKGFAVVASEIRKLADASKKSAERINTLVMEIQQATNSTVMVTEEGNKTVQTGTRLVQRTGEAFNGLSAAIDGTYESVQQIALNARQQSAAVNQVVDAMTSLNGGARETAAAISQTRAGILKLNEAAKELTALV